MNPRHVAAPVAVALALALGAGGADGAAKTRQCGTVKVESSSPVTLKVSVVRGPASCAVARSLMKTLYLGGGTTRGSGATAYRAIRGWRCDTGAGGGGCVKRGKNVDTAKDYVSALVK